jgi:hypothetical protein
MRMTAIRAQTERKRQDRSARCAEKHRRRARTRRLRGLIRPVPAPRPVAGDTQGGKYLYSDWIQAIFTSAATPLGECRFCMSLMAAFGLPVAHTEMVTFAGTKVLVIERFDRLRARDGRLIRLPQEDCCQALSVPPTRKYQSEGGPGHR